MEPRDVEAVFESLPELSDVLVLPNHNERLLTAGNLPTSTADRLVLCASQRSLSAPGQQPGPGAGDGAEATGGGWSKISTGRRLTTGRERALRQWRVP